MNDEFNSTGPEDEEYLDYEEDEFDEAEWDDPSTYAHCSDWEDEPNSCALCADDECPMNKS